VTSLRAAGAVNGESLRDRGNLPLRHRQRRTGRSTRSSAEQRE
jgi:hypothetical protein